MSNRKYVVVNNLHRSAPREVTIDDLRRANERDGWGERYVESCAQEMESGNIVNVIRNGMLCIVAVEKGHENSDFGRGNF